MNAPLTATQITFGKFEGTGNREDDRCADIFVDGVNRGLITANVENVGYNSDGFRTVSYEVELFDTSDTMFDTEWFYVYTRKRKGRVTAFEKTSTTHKAKREAREWIAKTISAHDAEAPKSDLNEDLVKQSLHEISVMLESHLPSSWGATEERTEAITQLRALLRTVQKAR